MRKYSTKFKTKNLLIGLDNKPKNFVIDINGIKIAGKNFIVIAGPCAAESKNQLLSTARAVKKSGANVFRAGLFKPRTSPYNFGGLGEKGLELLKLVKEQTGLPIITEAMSLEQLNLVSDFADIIQIGSRNMYNYPLLIAAGKQKKPVLLKRGFSATIEELLLAAEYIASQGNKKIILCERGIRTFADYTRNTLDLSAVPILKKLTYLPVIVDPSHATGQRELIEPLSLAGAACGADGLMVEVHNCPEKALSDGQQSLSFKEFKRLMKKIKKIIKALKNPK